MNRRGGPPSQLPTLTEVVGDAAPPPGFVASTSGARLLDETNHAESAGDLVKGQAQGVVVGGELHPGARGPFDRRIGAATAPVDGAEAGAPPIRQALTRKPRAPLAAPSVGAGRQLPLLAAAIDSVPAAGDPPAVQGAPEFGLGADIFENAGQTPAELADDQLVRAVLQDLQRHVDLMLEYRLRASLTPVLTQMADNLVRELRQELASTLRDVVKRAVSQELVRRRKR